MSKKYCINCGYDLSQIVSITNQAIPHKAVVEQTMAVPITEDEKIKQIVENVKRGRGRPRKAEGMKKIPIPKPQAEEPVEQSIPKQEPKQQPISQPPQISFKPLF